MRPWTFGNRLRLLGEPNDLFLINFFFLLLFGLNLTDGICLMICRMSLKCSGLYLSQFRITAPDVLANGDGVKAPTIAGDVYIHPSAKIHPTAKVIP